MLWVVLLIEIESAAAKSGTVSGRYLGETSDSTEHFNAIRNWLDICKTHKACNETVPTGFKIPENQETELPSRVIDIRPDIPVLRQSAPAESGLYATLSHCWGDPSIMPKTTLSNLEDQMHGIPVETLPRSFQDAIKVTRNLDIPYLWVDSLCIIQEGDDGADKDREISRMGNIYQLSVLTIAAGGASSSTEGCFRPRKAESRSIGPFVRMPYRTVEGKAEGNFYVYERKGTFNDEYHDNVEKCPLFTRGWVVQERLLSRRMVIFTEGEMIFECQTNLPINESGEIYKRQITLKEHSRLTYQPMDKGILQRYNTGDLPSWYAVVELYSRMNLSQTQDRLIAISGVAQEIQRTVASEALFDGESIEESQNLAIYVSGLWLNGLFTGLLWQCIEPGRTTSPDCAFPSWSWASVLQGVVWHKEMLNGKMECEIVSPEVVSKPWWQRAVFSAQHKIQEFISDQDARWAEWDSSKTASILPPSYALETWHSSCLVRKLAIRGRIRQVTRSSSRLGTAEAKLIAIWTGHWKDSQRRGPDVELSDYYGICGGNEYVDDEVQGWGSFERHPNSGTTTATVEFVSPPCPIYCLLISTRLEMGGFDFGYLGNSHKVHNVLYLRKSNLDGEAEYQRIGVGMIFGKDFFKTADTKQVSLV